MLDIYDFTSESARFSLNFVPDRNLKKQVISLFKSYDQFPEMKDFGVAEVKQNNKDIIDAIYDLGIFKIVVNTGFKDVLIFEDKPKDVFVNPELIKWFHEYKNTNPKIGLISYIDNINPDKPVSIFTDWLPRMVDLNIITSIERWETRYEILSYNIINVSGFTWFVLYKFDGAIWNVQSYVQVGESDIFNKNSTNTINRTKMLQIKSVNNSVDSVYSGWVKLYQERREYCNEEMSYDINFYDIIIYLHQLFELTEKVRNRSGILVWTTFHSEFNNEFREFPSSEYNPENRETVINLFNETEEKAYAILNDFFGKELI